MITENLSTLKIHKLTQEQYDNAVSSGTVNENELYLTPYEEIDLTPYATVEQLSEKASMAHEHTIDNIVNLQDELDDLQNELDNHTHEIADVSGLQSTLDGKASSSDVADLQAKVGTAPVSEQIENAINNISQNITTYNDPSQFGCTFASTLTEICNAIPNNSIFLCDAGNFTDASWNLPSQYGTILSFKINKARNILHFYGKTSAYGNYQMSFSNQNEPTGVWSCDLSSVLNSSVYGTTLPDPGIPGRIFFLKVSG